MLNRTVKHTSPGRTGRLLGLGFITVVLITAVARPATAALKAPDVTATEVAGPTQWTSRPPVNHARGGHGVVTVSGQIFAVSGFDSFDSGGLVEAVETRQVNGDGTWRDVAPLPTPRANLATAAVGGLVYAVGGYGEVDILKVMEVFNPGTGRWATGPPLPQPRGGAGAAGLGGLLYVAGGNIPPGANSYSLATNSMVVYDPRKNTWKPAAPMPTARERLRLVASGPYLYAIGGRGLSGHSLTTVERYEPNTDTWRTMNPMHESRVLPCAVETHVGQQRVLVVIAGVEFSDKGYFVDGRRTTEVLDLDTGRWTLLNILLPGSRGSHDCAVETDGTVLAIAGITNNGGPFIFLDNVDALALKPSDLQ